jgi:uncharacterized protein YodC (DUF2158 family)
MCLKDTVFTVGDVVRVKSGGHLMTVVSIDQGSVTCDWSVRGDIKSKSFPAAALEEAAPPPSLEAILGKLEREDGTEDDSK